MASDRLPLSRSCGFAILGWFPAMVLECRLAMGLVYGVIA